MSIDRNLNATAAPEVSAIENEIPTYRAISPTAVFALIFGVLAVLSFVDWIFLSCAVLAILLGVLAERKIQRFADVLTGRRLAQAAIGLGMIFGLTAVTIGSVQSMLRASQAKSFALQYEEVLRKGTLEQLIWYGQPPVAREKSSPEKVAEEMKKSAGGPENFMGHTVPFRTIKAKLAEPGAEVHFAKIESHGEIENEMYATALYDILSPQAKTPEEKKQYALAYMRSGKTAKGKIEWFVSDLKYPYQPETFVVAPKPVGDGHDHGQH